MKQKLLRLITILFSLPILLVMGIPPSSSESAYLIEGSRKRPWRNAGIPVDGAAGTYYNVADKGDLLIDTTNGTIYQNTNTKSSPTWTQLTASAIAYGAAGDMAAAGTSTANGAGIAAATSRTDHVHAIGTHDHSGATKGNPIVEAGITAASLTGLVAKVVADGNVIGGIPLLFRQDLAGGATATTNIVSTHKVEILDAWVVNKAVGTAGDTVTVKANGTACTDAMSIAGGDKTVARAGSIDDANMTVDAGQNIGFTETDGGGNDSPACTVYVLAIRVA